MNMNSVCDYKQQVTMAPDHSQSAYHFSHSDEEKAKYYSAWSNYHVGQYEYQSLDLNERLRSDVHCFQCPSDRHFRQTMSTNDGCNNTGTDREGNYDKESEDLQFRYKNEETNNGQFIHGQIFHKPREFVYSDLIDSSVPFQKRSLDTKQAFRKEEVKVHCANNCFLGGFTTLEDDLRTCSGKLNSNTTNSSDVKKNIQKINFRSNSFRNNHDTAVVKSKDVGTTLLPPCRVCGARASGFHYGVNSCEACKGFFRRALKRPMVFNCTNNNKCDIKGNKRSTCRFCRYTRCLRLGMSRESIKTGRYSHKKRTRDTIEVKRLQISPNVINSDSDLDNIIIKLLTAHNSTMTSTTHVPKNVIYQKQLEYHNLYVLRKKCGLSMTNSIDPSCILDNSSNRESAKNGESIFSECVKLSAPSRSSSQLSSDSGFVDEPDVVLDGAKSVVSENEMYISNEDSPDSIQESRHHTCEETNESPFANNVDHSGTKAAKNHQREQKSLPHIPAACDNSFLLRRNKQDCSDNRKCIHFVDTEAVTAQLSPETKLCISNGLSREKDNKQAVRHVSSKPETIGNVGNEILEHYANYINNCSKMNSETVICGERQNSVKKICHGSLNNGLYVKQSNGIHSQFASTKAGTVLCKSLFEILAKDTIRDSVPSSLQQDSNSETLSRSSANTMATCTDSAKPNNHDITQGLMSEIDCVHTETANAEFSEIFLMNKWKDSPDMHKKSKDQIIQRAQKWTKEYIDFAMQIPGFASLPCQDQATLLKHAWDEVWILGSYRRCQMLYHYRSYNTDLGVAIMPCGTCLHMEEMEMAWGEKYTRIAFDVADIINRQNLTPELIAVLKAICIISPDRCPLTTSKRVTEMHWLVVSSMLHYIELTHPGKQVLFPRLVSILTSLRELSGFARKDLESGRGDFMLDCNNLK